MPRSGCTGWKTRCCVASRRARFLAGLPAHGALTVAFGDGAREGLLVRFVTRHGSWIGSFARVAEGDASVIDSGLYDVGALTLIVAAGGAYLVDTDRETLVHPMLPGIDAVLSHGDGTLTLSDGSFLYRIERDGRVERSHRIAWNGIRALCEIDGVIHGEAYSARERGWTEFQLSRLR
jgi:hypothetical protein